MAIYTVLAPSARDAETGPGFDTDPMTFVFVKERFCWPAFFFAGPWLIFRRLWLVLVGYVLVAIVISVAAAPLGDLYPGLLVLALHVIFAMEANELRRWTLRRHGYRLIGIAEGRNIEEAEIRFFSRFETEASEAPTPATPPALPPQKPFDPGPVQPSAEAGDVVGLFPTPSGQPT